MVRFRGTEGGPARERVERLGTRFEGQVSGSLNSERCRTVPVNQNTKPRYSKMFVKRVFDSALRFATLGRARFETT